MDEGVTVRIRRSETPQAAQAQMMGLLGHHLPLCLIMDLVMPAGPHSRDLLEAERAVDFVPPGGRC